MLTTISIIEFTFRWTKTGDSIQSTQRLEFRRCLPRVQTVQGNITVHVLTLLIFFKQFQNFKQPSLSWINLGSHIFVTTQIGPEDGVPKETQWLYNNWEHTVRCRDGSIEGWEWDYLAPTFLVEPGRYCGILYNEKPGGSDTAYCIMVYSAVPLQIKWVTSHPVWYIFALFSRYRKCSFSFKSSVMYCNTNSMLMPK